MKLIALTSSIIHDKNSNSEKEMAKQMCVDTYILTYKCFDAGGLLFEIRKT